MNKLMNTSIKAEIMADSVAGAHRLTTFILEYPRFIHAEVLTHRMFSKNAASSRAIPVEKMIQHVIDNPAMPVYWGKNQPGMQASSELDDTEKRMWTWTNKPELYGEMTEMEYAKKTWLTARDAAIEYVRKLLEIGLHKQTANRLLEPWFNIRIILSGTDFQNFFALRSHKDAQPEFQVLASKMLEAYNTSTPKRLWADQWHIPFGDRIDENRLIEMMMERDDFIDRPEFKDLRPWAVKADLDTIIQAYKIKIAVARCARVSYFNFDGRDDYRKDIETCDKLFGAVPRHLSPTEHVAQAMCNSERYGNFIGWKQYRKFFTDENLTDKRVLPK